MQCWCCTADHTSLPKTLHLLTLRLTLRSCNWHSYHSTFLFSLLSSSLLLFSTLMSYHAPSSCLHLLFFTLIPLLDSIFPPIFIAPLHHTTPHYTIPYYTTLRHTTPHQDIATAEMKKKLLAKKKKLIEEAQRSREAEPQRKRKAADWIWFHSILFYFILLQSVLSKWINSIWFRSI